MAVTYSDEFRKLAERAITEPDRDQRERLLEQLRTLEEIENMRINAQMRTPQIEIKLGPIMTHTTAPTPVVVPARLGRRLQLSPHSTEVSDMSRTVHLPPITITHDLARRMKQRLGLASFINLGEFNVQSRFELRWRR